MLNNDLEYPVVCPYCKKTNELSSQKAICLHCSSEIPPRCIGNHVFGPRQEVRDKNFAVLCGHIRTCEKCKWSEYTNYAVSSGPGLASVGIYPPDRRRAL